MTKDNDQLGDSGVLDQILKHAGPRQRASEIVRARALNRLHDHWLKTTRRQRIVRKAWPWAIAAAVLLSITLMLNLGGVGPENVPLTVAKVNRVTGDTAVLLEKAGSQVAITPNTELSTFTKLATGENSRIAVSWNSGGSLRLDTNTKVALISPTRISLTQGVVYYDSYDYESRSSAKAKAIIITTPYGEISHVGTQFSVSVQESSLLLRVREGMAQITNDVETALIDAGSEGLITSQGIMGRQHVNSYGAPWHWAEEIGPLYTASGKSPEEVLAWIGRETGRKLVYTTPESLKLAQSQRISGLENVSPAQALTAIPYATRLVYKESAGIIEIRIVN